MVTVRAAQEDDLEQILAILNEPEMDHGRALPLDQAVKRYQGFLREPWRHILVAVDGERILGTLTLFIIEHLSHQGGCSGLLEEVIVTGELRGQGVGRELCNHALNLAKDKGCYKIALSSNLKRLGAHAFYETLGYRKHGFSFDLRLS